jgi:hypothetical protein
VKVDILVKLACCLLELAQQPLKQKLLESFTQLNNDEFLSILDRFPEQKGFLKAIARQRLQTTDPEDLIHVRIISN